MIRFITLLTVTLLLTISCSDGSDADPAQVATSAPTATVPTQAPAPLAAPTQVPAIVGTVNFQVDVQTVTTASQIGMASVVGPSLIRLKDGRYRLYLQARANRDDINFDGVNIVSLISSDGTQWDVEPGIRISHGSESDVDSEAGEPGVYLGLDDKYHMAYTGRFMGVNRRGAKQKMHRIVFAASEDGLTWLKLNKHYADPQNINDFASSADVNIVNGQYVIYYTVKDSNNYESSVMRIVNVLAAGGNFSDVTYGPGSTIGVGLINRVISLIRPIISAPTAAAGHCRTSKGRSAAPMIRPIYAAKIPNII